MLDKLNKIRNSNFIQGISKPQSWSWLKRGQDVTWTLDRVARNGDLAGMRIESGSATGHGLWAQRFRCKTDQHYRIEAVVTCDCSARDEAGGLVLSLHPFGQTGRALSPLHSTPIEKADKLTLRLYYKSPAKVRQAELRIGLVRAAGSVCVHDVCVVPVIEPEFRSYPAAVPPAPFVDPPPVKVSSVCVVADDPDRPIVGILRARYGTPNVRVVAASQFRPETHDDDGVLLLSPTPPACCRSMNGLLELAERRVVVVSLPCFEAIASGRAMTRLIRQVDDPIQARVVHSNYMTTAFALHDIFPFAGRADHTTAMAQRQFRTNLNFRGFCDRYQLEVMLDSMTDADATSEKPIALFRRMEKGALVCMDIEPAEAVTSSLDEPTLTVQLLLAALGDTQHAIGQYATAARTTTELLNQLSDVAERFPALTWAADGKPEEFDRPLMLTVGDYVNTYGLPMPQRPVILIRSGLSGEDVAGVYGVMFWLKQLLKPAPYACPYLKPLIAKYRLAWIPLNAPLPPWCGWQAQRAGQAHQWIVEPEFDSGMVAACIDVTSTRRHEINVVCAEENALSKTLADALPALAAPPFVGRSFYRAVPDGASAQDRSALAWRRDALRPCVKADHEAFGDVVHRAAGRAGAQLVKIEVPTTGCDPAANSVWCSDWAACLLEQVVGLLLGVVVVNRSPKPAKLQLPESLKPLRDRIVLRRINGGDDSMKTGANGNGTITIAPGCVLMAVKERQ